MARERLQKIMARFGVASRRKSEEFIEAGRVKVNGETVTQLGFKADPAVDRIEVDGQVLQEPEEHVYYLLNKPVGVVTTVEDPQGRTTVIDLLPDVQERVYPVGRLDYDTEGLLLLTNDGDVTYALTHPRFKIEKGYLVEARGRIPEAKLTRLRSGIDLSDGKTAPARVKAIEITRNRSLIEMYIHEGRNRQIRRMLEAIGHPVQRLKRFQFGPLDLAGLAVGEYRKLTAEEEAELRKIADRVRIKSR